MSLSTPVASELAHFSGLEVDAPAFIDLTKNWVAKRQYTSVLSLPNPNTSHLIDGSNGLGCSYGCKKIEIGIQFLCH